MPSTLRVDRDGRVMTVRIDNPPHNFMNRQMVAELDEVTASVEGDSSIGAVVITGATDGLFITHYDVEEILAGSETMDMTFGAGVAGATLRAVGGLSKVPGGRMAVSRTPARGVAELRKIHDLFLRWNRMDKVFIAAINGPAMGGGSETALACDLRYIAADSPGIGQPELAVGFPPGAGGTQRLTRAVGTSRALELILEAKPLAPKEALEIGWVHAVFPAAELASEAASTAQRMARRTPESVAGAKRAVYEGASLSLQAGLALERKWFLSAVSTDASKRAMRAYVEEVEDAHAASFADRDRSRPWEEGTAADLVGR
jgi:enoyl-CoA hydratase